MKVLYEDYPRWDPQNPERPTPLILNRAEAKQWDEIRLHPRSKAYFDPYDGLGVVAKFLETFVSTKELLVAAGASVYFFWLWRNRLEKERREKQISRHKERLESLLERTFQIERAHMEDDDPNKLRAYLEQVNQIKLRGMHNLSVPDLLNDHMLSIFLIQCSDLIGRIESKLSVVSHSEAKKMAPPNRGVE